MAHAPLLLDWTSERLRAWSVQAGSTPRPVPLENSLPELPLVLSMAERRLQLGQSAARHSRIQPQQVIDCFLPYVGQDRAWHYGRHHMDAREVLGWVLGKIKEKLPSKAVFHVLPSYWQREQAAILEDQTRQLGYRCLGSMKRGLALAGLSPGLIIDIDNFAASIIMTQVQGRTGHLHLESIQTVTALALPIWKERIAAIVATRCLRDSRRDPRAHAETDQQLEEQLHSRLIDLASQSDIRLSLKQRDWNDEVLLPHAEVHAVCAPLAMKLAELAIRKPEAETWFLSPEAARLPGLPQALYAASNHQRSLSVLPAEVMPQALTAWITQIDQGILSPPSWSEVLPVISPISTEAQPDTLPFARRTRK